MTGIRYVVKAVDGTVYEGRLGVDIIKTLDKRSDQAPAQLVYEARHPVSGVFVRLWPEDVLEVGGAPV